MKTKFLKLLTPLVALPFFLTSCLDLDETYFDQVNPDLIPPLQRVEGIYRHLLGSIDPVPPTTPWYPRGITFSIQTSTDEMVIPLQGANNWFDGGIYLQMHHHTWTPDNAIFLSAWNYLYNIISNANALLARYSTEHLSYRGVAELQTLRAYAYFRLIDLFGNVPKLYEGNFPTLQMPPTTPRAEMFHWIVEQLTYIRGTEELVADHLPLRRHGGMTQGVLHTLKARMFLNANIFLGIDDNSQEYREFLERAIEATEAVTALGRYSLESNVFANWFVDNGARSREIIFAVPFVGDGSGEGNVMHMHTLPGPAAGMDRAFGNEMFAHGTSGLQVQPGLTREDPNALFNLFSEHDNRRLSILHGQVFDRQVYVETRELRPITFGVWSRNHLLNPTPGIAGNPRFLNMDPHFTLGFDPANSGALIRNSDQTLGARFVKFELEETPAFYESPTDMIIMRYTEVLYTRAEALIRLGRGAEAVPIFQQVLAHRGFDPMDDSRFNRNFPFRVPDTYIDGTVRVNPNSVDGLNISAVALMSKRWLNPVCLLSFYPDFIPANPCLRFMDDEWRREFIFEDRRRTDMIRMRIFTTGGWDGQGWGGHTPTNRPNRNIFPIPQSVLDGHDLVLQNAWE